MQLGLSEKKMKSNSSFEENSTHRNQTPIIWVASITALFLLSACGKSTGDNNIGVQGPKLPDLVSNFKVTAGTDFLADTSANSIGYKLLKVRGTFVSGNSQSSSFIMKGQILAK